MREQHFHNSLYIFFPPTSGPPPFFFLARSIPVCSTGSPQRSSTWLAKRQPAASVPGFSVPPTSKPTSRWHVQGATDWVRQLCLPLAAARMWKIQRIGWVYHRATRGIGWEQWEAYLVRRTSRMFFLCRGRCYVVCWWVRRSVSTTLRILFFAHLIFCQPLSHWLYAGHGRGCDLIIRNCVLLCSPHYSLHSVFYGKQSCETLVLGWLVVYFGICSDGAHMRRCSP